jgi:hypothetical protein
MEIRKHIRFAWILLVGFVFLLIVLAKSGTAGLPPKGADSTDMKPKNRVARPESFMPKSYEITVEGSRGVKSYRTVGIQPDGRLRDIITQEASISGKGSSRSLFGEQLAFNPQPEPPKDKVNPPDEKSSGGFVPPGGDRAFNPQPEPPKDKVNPPDEKSSGGFATPGSDRAFNPQPEPPKDNLGVTGHSTRSPNRLKIK